MPAAHWPSFPRGVEQAHPEKEYSSVLRRPPSARTIELLKLTHLFERIIVSTDDSEIAALAVQAGADVPFRRPAELSGDRAATAPVVEHSVRVMADAGFMPAFVCCVYPAAVLTRGEDFAAAYAMLRDTSCDYVFSATTFQSSIHRALRIDDAGGVSMFWPQ